MGILWTSSISGITFIGGGAIGVFSFIDRDTVGTAGGVRLTLTVAGIVGNPTVTINGVNCTAVTIINSTTITCVTPALSAGGPYTVTCGGKSLTGALTVIQSPSTTYANVNFETSGTLAQVISPISTDGGSRGAFITTGSAHRGIHSCAFNASGSGGVVQLLYQFANNAVLTTHNPNGVYFRWYQAYDQKALDAAWSTGQYKMHLARYLDHSGQGAGYMLIHGTSAGLATAEGQLEAAIDFGITNLAIVTTLTAMQWVEFQVWYSRVSGSGVGNAKLWVNGKLANSVTNANLFQDGDTSSDHLYLQIGIPFTTDTSSGGITYVDEVKIADGFIDPETDEPMYNPTTDMLMWSDNFESYTDTGSVLAAYPAYANPQYLQFPSPDGGQASSKAMRFNIPVQVTYNDVSLVLEKAVAAPLSGTICVVEWWMKCSPGYSWLRFDSGSQTSAGCKTMILDNNASNPRRRLVASVGVQPAGSFLASGSYKPFFPSSGVGYVISHDGSAISGVGNAGSQWYIQNMNSQIDGNYLADNNWHYIKIKTTCSSYVTSTTGDGKVEMWVDGLQIMKYDGTDITRPEYGLVLTGTTPNDNIVFLDFPNNMNGGPSPTQGAMWRDYDNIKLWVR